MKITIAGILIVLVILIKLIYDERVFRARLEKRLKEDWGKIPDGTYTSEKFNSLKAYYLKYKEEDRDIDDITWKDLDMDEIFMNLNRTQCAAGEEYLYRLLRKPGYEEKELLQRESLIDFFYHHEEARLSIQKVLARLGKLKNISLYLYINRLNEVEEKSPAIHYFCAGGLLFSIALLFASGFLGIKVQIPIILFLCFLVFNIYQYYKKKAAVDSYFITFSYVMKLLWGARQLCSLPAPAILREYIDRIRKAEGAFSHLKRGAGVVTGSAGVSGNPLDLVLDYMRMLFHIDLIKFRSMLRELKKNIEQLNIIFETIGLLDSMIAAASFRAGLPLWCVPSLEASGKTGKKPFLNAEGLYHPLVSNAVVNTIKEEKSVLLTGSNASGKSTFIKALAINALLAQTVHTGTAAAYSAGYFRILSSMALSDNLQDGESYFIVEIKSLKRILDAAGGELPVLCFVDEVLRGTNTPERIAASSRILKSLSGKNAVCFAATHDIELTYILENYFDNYHFQEKIENGTILFDYRLWEGRAVSRNAIRLLDMMGYEKEVTRGASEAVDLFLKNGAWETI